MTSRLPASLFNADQMGGEIPSPFEWMEFLAQRFDKNTSQLQSTTNGSETWNRATAFPFPEVRKMLGFMFCVFVLAVLLKQKVYLI